MSQPHSLYWFGLYESECSKEWKWFFQTDLTPAICCGVVRGRPSNQALPQGLPISHEGTESSLDPVARTHDPQASEEASFPVHLRYIS
jgi:hypothetical protein